MLNYRRPPNQWITNLSNIVGEIPNHQLIKDIFSSFLELIFQLDWEGACHESCGAIYILLNEVGVDNNWCIGCATIDGNLFDHSWIEINNEIYDLAIINPNIPSLQNAPVIRGIDIHTNFPTIAQYGIKTDIPDSQETEFVKNSTLSDFLLKSPINPLVGTWHLIERVSHYKLNLPLEINELIRKYNGKHFTIR